MNRLKERGKLPPFVPLPWDLLNSKAYRELASSSAKALPYFLGKPKENLASPEAYDIVFDFTYSEAERYGFATSTFKRVISDLMEKGFIDPVWKGGLRKNGSSSNKFRLSLRWKEYGRTDFKQIEWKEFLPSAL